jgi:hypothetical protein
MPKVRLADRTDRKGDWICLRFMDRFYFDDPRPSDFAIEDIAHGLSMICRFGGQAQTFYSVAQHSVLVAAQVPQKFRREALLHDRAEAYLGSDLVRPIKYGLPVYGEMERRILAVSAPVFDVPVEMSSEVHEADERMLVTEARQLFTGHKNGWWLDRGWPNPYNAVRITPWDPERARDAFMNAWRAA